MKKIKKWLLMGSAGFLAGGFLLLLVVTAAGAFAEDLSAAFGGRRTGAAAGNMDPVGNVPGKATYVGVDDTETDFSRKVAAGIAASKPDPFYSGYAGLCELWVYDVYAAAGLPCNGTCCAYNHGVLSAQKEGLIPKGALIFSGIIPATGKLYENNHRAGAFCNTCGHYAGHVGIYVGNGYVAGSQVPYLQSVDAWISVYGYGGWAWR